MQYLGAAAAFVVGVNLWFLFEYLLHRFAMHALHGRGIMSREHLEHHVHAGWSFDYTHILSWLGVGLMGAAVWLPVGYLIGGWWVAVPLALGWPIGYAFYEYEHAMCHLRPPRTRYQRWVRKHHFEHHFGTAYSQFGLSSPLWDFFLGTFWTTKALDKPKKAAKGE